MLVSEEISQNIDNINKAFADCGDLVKRELTPCPGASFFLAYIDNLADRQTIDRQVVTSIMTEFGDKSVTKDILSTVKAAVQTLEVSEETELEKIHMAILSGDTALFTDGSPVALIISSKGFKSRGVPEAGTESTVMGSKEAFSEVMRTNTVLIRRRIRDTRLKVKQFKTGRRSGTDIALMYMEDIVRPEILAEAERRVNGIRMDAVSDTGIMEQLIEDDWRSPFPQVETTERPDKAAASILEGRVAVVVDNSPFTLLLPATLNTFYQASEDYYQRFEIASLTRILRFAAGLMALALPGLYIAVAVYHPTMLPSLLLLKMAEARQNVPFPAVIEILLMEAAFELLREAGTRMPKAVGGTFGIVGGIIVGQAAVEAGIVSPVVVIIVALTAISSFAIPHYTLVSGYRLTKYIVILLSSALGLLGFCSSAILLLTHLASLKSFGIPYLFPFVSGEVNGYSDLKDSIIRFPIFAMKKRPLFARKR